MASKNPDDRILVAKIASAERWGRCSDRPKATEPARAGLRAKFALEVDPDGTLDPAELERRVDHLLRAHMLRMSLKAKASRRKAAELTALAELAETELAEVGGPDGD